MLQLLTFDLMFRYAYAIILIIERKKGQFWPLVISCAFYFVKGLIKMVYLPPPFIDTWGESANPKTCQRSNKSASGGSGGDEFCSNWHYKTYILELHLSFWESQVNPGSSRRGDHEEIALHRLWCHRDHVFLLGHQSRCLGFWVGSLGMDHLVIPFRLYGWGRSLRATDQVPMPDSKVFGNTLLVCLRSGVEVEDF